MSTLSIRHAHSTDVPALSAFMESQGQDRCSAAYLEHWYFRNPSGSASVIIGEMGGRIVGVATTNDHIFEKGGKEVLVGMPQKVLTDEATRGQGVFGRLHAVAEEACLDRGVEMFLTVTNAASTPIFIERFGYRRLPVPRMALLLPSIGAVPIRSEGCGPPRERAPNQDAWRMKKDPAHFSWRYTQDPLKEYTFLQVSDDGSDGGWIVLRRIRRARLPMSLVMDMVPERGGTGTKPLKMARRLALHQRSLGLLALEESWNSSSLRRASVARRSSGLALLVKGKDGAHTQALLNNRFDLAFGDLDFF